MAISKVAAVVLLAVMSAPSVNKQNKQTIDDKFYAQVDKTNVALDRFLRLDCTDKENGAAAQDLAVQIHTLNDLYKALPASPGLNQSEAFKLKESETFVGFIEVSDAYVNMKLKACVKESTPKGGEDKTPYPASLNLSTS